MLGSRIMPNFGFPLRFFAVAAALFLVAPCAATAQPGQDFRLSSPVDCTGLELCFVQNYVDHDSGPKWTDYTCRHLSYDDHGGTDIRVSFADMSRGVPVLAVADGIVLGVRDGMADESVRIKGKKALRGKFAGNAVFIDHNGGIETQYSHLRKGSVLVNVGDFVRRGQPLGMVGLSGSTEFPHVELGLLIAGQRVDPFTGEGTCPCGSAAEPLWDEEALGMLAYQPRGVVDAAFVNGLPNLSRELLRPKRAYHPELGKRMTFWAAMFGVAKGDELRISITGPDGEHVTERCVRVGSDLAQDIIYASARNDGGWPPGVYVGRCELLPAEPGQVPVVVTREITIPAAYARD